MFDELKKRLSSAIKGIVRKEEEEIEKPLKKEDDAGREAPKQDKVDAARDAHAEDAIEAEETAYADAHEENAAAGHRSEQAGKGREDAIRFSLGTRIKSKVLRSVALNNDDIAHFLEALQVSMLESDVAYDTTEKFIGTLDRKLHSLRFDSNNLSGGMIGAVRESLLGVLNTNKGNINLNGLINASVKEGKTPVRILFLGPNGAGKTTMIAKLAHMLKSNGISCVMSASDTFRAAAIEQTEFHANKVGVPVIKGSYGADPASVAFDAIAYAKSHRISVVLIDTAGRQETNKNLISEIQKISRITKPDATIFIGESTSGNRIAEQIKEFSKSVKIDGIILTKLDCDAKGGSAISISDITGIPILFFGTGESYDALVEYRPEFIADAVLPNN